MSLKLERQRLRRFQESTLCWKTCFSLIELVINVNLTLRRHNVSSVVSSSPQREPENISDKLESGTGSQHNTSGYVQFDSFLKSAAIVFDG